MVKILSRINGSALQKKIAIETTFNTGDVSVTLQNTTVPANYQLASAVITVATIPKIIGRAISNEVKIEMHQALADKIIDLGIHGHTCHPKNS
jgi:hypothetical protein